MVSSKRLNSLVTSGQNEREMANREKDRCMVIKETIGFIRVEEAGMEIFMAD